MTRAEKVRRVQEIAEALEAKVQMLPKLQRKRYHVARASNNPLRILVTFTVPRPDQISRVIRWLESEGMQVPNISIAEMFVMPDIIRIPCDFVGLM